MNLPWQDFQKVYVPEARHLHEGADGLVHQLAGLIRRRRGRPDRYLARGEAIVARGQALRINTDASLIAAAGPIRLALQLGRANGQDIDEALALLIEVAHRTTGLRAHAEQAMGALGLWDGFLIEMATGEGKSLTAALAAVIVGWSRRPCHILTVNDYLAVRDVEFFSDFFAHCQVSVAAITQEMNEPERREGYQAEVVYTTGKQLLADFLFDRLRLRGNRHPARRLLQRLAVRTPEDLILRGIDTVIVDEADSILIDEAVSPLIISRSRENQVFIDAVKAAGTLAERFNVNEHYDVHEKYRLVELNEAGKVLLDDLGHRLPGIWKGRSRREELLTQALLARTFYEPEVHYVVSEGKVVIVDEYTGRMMPGRSWGNGLHQAVEAREGVEVTPPSETVVRMSFQTFFRLFRQISGMTGTASEAADEFWRIYHLPVMRVPNHVPCIRQILAPVISPDKTARRAAIVQEVLVHHSGGEPVLVGTRNVADSEALAAQLHAQGIDAQVINAVRHETEAEIVSHAGERGKVTIATNMAGRGTDIKLGADLDGSGGLHVIVTERHNSARIDRQLVGRSARQGDPGSARVYMSLDDEILVQGVPSVVVTILRWMLGKAPVLAGPLIRGAFSWAQWVRQRYSFRQRRQVLLTDNWLEESITFGDPSRMG